MFPFLRLGLLALLRGIKSIGYTLKSFVLRYLLFRPHILRSFRSLCSGTSPKDVSKKKGGKARPSFPGTSGGCEGYSTICASRDSGRPRSQLGSVNTENFLLSPMMAQPQSTPHSPASTHAPSLHDSPQLSDRQLSAGSAPSIADSHNAEILPPIHYLNTPLTFMHSRETSTQFGAPSPGRPRSRSRSRTRHPHTFLQSSTLATPATSPFHSRPPSLLEDPNPQPHTSPQSSILETAASPVHSRPPSPLVPPHPQLHPLPRSSSPGSSQIPDTESEHEIRVHPPSRSQTVDLDSQNTTDLPQFPLPFQQGHLPGPSQFPTAGTEHSTPTPSDLGGSGSPYLTSGGVRNGSGSLPLTPSSNQAPLLQFRSQVTVGNIPTAGPSGTWHDGKTRIIRPMHSDQVSRYVNKGDVSSENGDYILHPMEWLIEPYHASLYASRPKGWEPVTHPGGALYFYNAERRIFTDVYMYDHNLSTEIHAFAAYLDERRRAASQSPLLFPTNDYDLVLDIAKMEDNKVIGAYYYVDHVTKTLFWQEHYDCKDSLLREVRGGQRDPGHVKLRLESLYWVHWSLYPTGPKRRKFPEEAQKELLGALLSSGIDSLTSKVSTSPYTVAEIESMRDFIKEAEGKSFFYSLRTAVIIRRRSRPRKSSCYIVTRLLSFYAHWKFLHFHGQKVSRQDRYKSIYEGSHRKRTILVRILSPILFFFPDVHLLELEKVWTDEIVVEALWREFMQKLVSEWTEFVLYSTVMLAANVAFLAIPGVIIAPPYPTPPGPNDPPSPNTWIKPSPAQIASSISLVFSIGSIITGLLLIRRNRTMMTKDPQSAWYYLHGMKKPWFGLEPLAIVFSLTYALLMWSAWGFFVALLIFSFQDTSMRIWIPVGSAAGIITALIVWCIGNTWDPKEREENPIDWLNEPHAESQENGTWLGA
ncbi:hypothetical protein EDB84DRAFT_1580353 [Lactarius hengduanensis]|nr:hypothetical protein EDB84DRAFT_1580353 [Lactarius hengduanensis]